MKKPSVFGNNCSVEIIPVFFLESIFIYQSTATIKLKDGYEGFLIDTVANTIDPNINNQDTDAGTIYNVSLSFRIAYTNPDTTIMLQTLKNYGSLVVKFRTPGKRTLLFGSIEYPVRLTFSTPSNFDGYEVTLTGTQDLPPAFIE